MVTFFAMWDQTQVSLLFRDVHIDVSHMRNPKNKTFNKIYMLLKLKLLLRDTYYFACYYFDS